MKETEKSEGNNLFAENSKSSTLAFRMYAEVWFTIWVMVGQTPRWLFLTKCDVKSLVHNLESDGSDSFASVLCRRFFNWREERLKEKESGAQSGEWWVRLPRWWCIQIRCRSHPYICLANHTISSVCYICVVHLPTTLSAPAQTVRPHYHLPCLPPDKVLGKFWKKKLILS